MRWRLAGTCSDRRTDVRNCVLRASALFRIQLVHRNPSAHRKSSFLGILEFISVRTQKSMRPLRSNLMSIQRHLGVWAVTSCYPYSLQTVQNKIILQHIQDTAAAFLFPLSPELTIVRPPRMYGASTLYGII